MTLSILDLGYTYGTTATYSYSTTISRSYDGSERRIPNWVSSKATYQIGNKSLTYSELNSLISFHKAVKGSLSPFLFKDYSDYRATNSSLGTVSSSKLYYPITKTYSFGDTSNSKVINHVDGSTFKLYANGTQTNSYTLTSNYITVPTLANGTVLTADFEYYVLVRFQLDTIDFTLNAVDPSSSDRIYQLNNVSLVEVKEFIPLPEEVVQVVVY